VHSGTAAAAPPLTRERGTLPERRRRTFSPQPSVGSTANYLATTAAIGIAILLLAASAWLARANMEDVRKADSLTEQVGSVQLLLAKMLSTLTDAETGQRGYLLTGNPDYLAPYEAARTRLPADFERLRAEPQVSGERSLRLDSIETRATVKMAELARTIALFRAGQRRRALSLVRGDRGKHIMDAIRAEIAALNPSLDAELLQNRLHARSVWPRVGIVALGVLASLLLAGVALGQRRERRAIGASLASLKRFTRAFDLSQGMLRGTDGTILFWAEGMQRLYGYTAEEAVGKRSHQLLHTEFPIPLPQIEAIVASEDQWQGELVHRHRDGSIIEVASHWAQHDGPPGEPNAIIEINIDITERKQRMAQLAALNTELSEALTARITAQKALARTEREFRASFEGSAVGKTQSDPSTGRFIRANGAFAKMLGYEPEELHGRTDRELTWPADRERDMTELARVLAGETDAFIREKRYRTRDGLPVWARVSSTITRSDTHEPTLSTSVIEDIDERYKALLALRIAKVELEMVVDQRTVALAQRDVLLREVYHRVKNNLQVVDGLLVMQARQLTDPAGKTALLGLRSRVHALGLVHHQLMHSKNLKTFDIAPFLTELSSNLLSGGAGDGIALSVHAIPLEVGLDFAIPLGLLVAELVTNSLKHAFPQGKGTITVSLDRAEDGSVALVVSDNGRGRSVGDGAHGSISGIGTSIINGLVNQLQGTTIMGNEQGARTEIRVAAPVLS
jgi:PAS domain S-box-containing protein